jgi:ribose/xylose/arabinose/galactoside ABC-type transport system permease subunit
MTKAIENIFEIIRKVIPKNFLRQTGIFWAFLLLSIIMALSQPAFLTLPNITNILKQISINGILAVGMTLVLISGGIDLSVGSIVAVSCVASAYFAGADSSYPIIIPFMAAIAVGGFLGAINGVGVAHFGFAPFIMTLAMLTMARGLVLLITNARPIFNLTRPFINVSNTFFLGLPNLIWYFALVLILCHILLRKTVFGKWTYAVGGNEAATRLSGVNVKNVKLILYSICGALAGLAGLLLASRITSGNPRVGDGYELDAIAAAVIGGVSMAGGSGTIIGTLIGVLILGVIQNGFDILGLSTFYQQIMKGVIILFAVFVDIRAKKNIKKRYS